MLRKRNLKSLRKLAVISFTRPSINLSFLKNSQRWTISTMSKISQTWLINLIFKRSWRQFALKSIIKLRNKDRIMHSLCLIRSWMRTIVRRLSTFMLSTRRSAMICLVWWIRSNSLTATLNSKIIVWVSCLSKRKIQKLKLIPSIRSSWQVLQGLCWVIPIKKKSLTIFLIRLFHSGN